MRVSVGSWQTTGALGASGLTSAANAPSGALFSTLELTSCAHFFVLQVFAVGATGRNTELRSKAATYSVLDTRIVNVERNTDGRGTK